MKAKIKNLHLKPAKQIFTQYPLYLSVLLFINVVLTLNSQGINLKQMGLFYLLFGFIANLVAALYLLFFALFTTQAPPQNWDHFFNKQKNQWKSFGKSQKKEWGKFIDKNAHKGN